MKRLVYVIIMLGVFISSIQAQEIEQSDKKAQSDKKDEAEKKKQKREISVWNITEETAQIVPASLDSNVFTFQQSNQVDRYSIANSYNGTMGSPLQSKIYSDRTYKSDFLFSRPYDAYYIAPSEVLFFNTKTPFSKVTYHSGGTTDFREDNISGLFSINANKRTNFTGIVDYGESLGYYGVQATKMMKSGIWGSYLGRWYQMSGIVMYHSFNNQENGGVQNPVYITNPDSLGNYEMSSVPVNLSDAMSRYRNFYAYLNQKISFGKGRHATNSITKDSVRIFTLSHTAHYEVTQKRYRATDDSAFYKNNYFDTDKTLDSARCRSLRNIVALSVNEGFSRWFPLGITAYLGNEYLEYYNLNDTVAKNSYENNVFLGAEMVKYSGRAFLFNAKGEIYTIGKKAGDFNLQGGIGSSFHIGKDTIQFKANGLLKNQSPNYFENNYISNHFIWKNDFERTFRARVDGSLELKNRWLLFNIGVFVENVNHLIYYDSVALPAQYNSNIQILSGSVKLNFKFGPLYLENKVIYQKSSNQDVMPLPEWSTYNNLFFGFKVFKKVLTAQIGTDMYYNSSYYAPAYMPATGVFYSQDKQLIGDHPVMSFYANFHIKTMTFYLKYYHLNTLFMDNSFHMPDYPMYPATFRYGITVNFFN